MSNAFKTYKLSELATILVGGDLPDSYSTEKTNLHNIPVYSNGEKENGLYGYTDIPEVTEPAVTISARGSKVGFAALRKEPFLPIVRLISLIPYKEKLDVNFLFYNLKLNRQTGIGSGQPQITIPDISNRTISVPPLSTQKKIASVLSALDDKIELNNRINTELEAMAKTIYDYWFVQFDFPDANGKPYKSSGGKMVYNDVLKREVPEGWEVKSLSDLIEVKDGTHDSPKFVNNGFPLVTSKNLKKSGIDFRETNLISKRDFDNINLRSKVDTGDILFSMIGNIGTIYKIDEEKVDFAIKNVALFKTSKNNEFKNFLFQYLHSYDMLRYMPNVISGSIQKFIGLSSLRATPVLYNEEIIEKFRYTSESIYERIKVNTQQNQELFQLRDWLLPMLMNGQVSVAGAYQQAAQALSMAAEDAAGYGKKKSKFAQ